MKNYTVKSAKNQGVYKEGEVIATLTEAKYKLNYGIIHPSKINVYGNNLVRVEEKVG